MRTITGSGEHDGTEHFVFDLTHEQVNIDFGQGHQIDDVLISTPDGDLFLSWDNASFSSENCILVKAVDNLKEFNNIRCTKIHVMGKDPDKSIRVYLTIQRN